MTYSRMPQRGGRAIDERVEPVLDAREVPYPRADLRAEPRAGQREGGFDDYDMDEFAEDAPRGRGRKKKGGGARFIFLAGVAALLVGGAILAYAYTVATRLDGPTAAPLAAAPDTGIGQPAASGEAAALSPSAPEAAGDPAISDGVRRVPLGGSPFAPDSASAPADAQADSPATASVSPSDGAAPQAEAAPPVIPPKPMERPPQIARQPAEAAPAPSADGLPMDGAFAAPGGAQPALVAPVPATATPPAIGSAPAATANAPAAPAPVAKGTGGSDDLMSNIEALLKRDAPPVAADTAPAGTAPGDPTALNAPTTLSEVPSDGDTVIDATAAGNAAILPPADVAPAQRRMLLPPADIPNLPPAGATGVQ